MTPQPPNESEVSGASAACVELGHDGLELWKPFKEWADARRWRLDMMSSNDIGEYYDLFKAGYDHRPAPARLACPDREEIVEAAKAWLEANTPIKWARDGDPDLKHGTGGQDLLASTEVRIHMSETIITPITADWQESPDHWSYCEFRDADGCLLDESDIVEAVNELPQLRAALTEALAYKQRVEGLTKFDDADVEIMLNALRHYADYNTWPGHNPKVNIKEWSKWYESGGYDGFNVARHALAAVGVSLAAASGEAK